MTNKIEQYRKILKCAPNVLPVGYDNLLACESYGRVSYLLTDESKVYFYHNGEWMEDVKGNYPINEVWHIRQLSDLQAIVNQHDEIERLKSLVTEVSDELNCVINMYNKEVKDPCKFIDAETPFNAMKSLTPQGAIND